MMDYLGNMRNSEFMKKVFCCDKPMSSEETQKVVDNLKRPTGLDGAIIEEVINTESVISTATFISLGLASLIVFRRSPKLGFFTLLGAVLAYRPIKLATSCYFVNPRVEQIQDPYWKTAVSYWMYNREVFERSEAGITLHFIPMIVKSEDPQAWIKNLKNQAQLLRDKNSELIQSSPVSLESKEKGVTIVTNNNETMRWDSGNNGRLAECLEKQEKDEEEKKKNQSSWRKWF